MKNHVSLNRRTLLASAAASVPAASLLGASRANAQTASYTPQDLKPGGALMPLGGLKAGNADGSIPAWDGGYSTLPAGYQPGDPRPVPFADESPILTITAANFPQYKDKLPDGEAQLFQKYPDYKVNVYPTHRTAIAPQWVYDNTYANATSAQMSADGNSLTGAYGGTPFPIPTNGHQVVWNHLLAWKGVTTLEHILGLTVTSSGEVVFGARITQVSAFPYYYPDRKDSFSGYYYNFNTLITAPAFNEGSATLAMQPINSYTTPARSWQYLLGQRRVREAPELQYDTPNYFTSGIGDFDEFQVFYGPLDEYDFNLVGKKEMYMPYNMNKAWATPYQQQLGPHYFNPDVARWELHRVWVVEMTVKPGKRNVDARRILYCDEDTWNALACDVYDSTGAYWKYIWSTPVALADIPCVLGSNGTMLYDFHAGVYAASQIVDSSCQQPWKPIPEKPDSYFSAAALAALAGGN